jgi:putative Holliday junction resolvase
MSAGRILAVDLGTRRVGLAISDQAGGMALALEAFERARGETTEALADRVAARAREEGAAEIVVGLPLHMDGKETEATRAARRFARLLEERIPVPVATWDERLSSHEAERRMRGAPGSRRRRRLHVNAVAAQVILEEYLAYRSSGGLGSSGPRGG